MRIKLEPLKGKDLKPGDLFSSAGQEYWEHRDPLSIAEKVYIRTDAPLPPDQEEKRIYRVSIEGT